MDLAGWEGQKANMWVADVAPAAAAAAPPPGAPAAGDKSLQLTQLEQLGELKAQGILTDAEFEAQKRKILGA